jgi:hypothetical protein
MDAGEAVRLNVPAVPLVLLMPGAAAWAAVVSQSAAPATTHGRRRFMEVAWWIGVLIAASLN